MINSNIGLILWQCIMIVRIVNQKIFRLNIESLEIIKERHWFLESRNYSFELNLHADKYIDDFIKELIEHPPGYKPFKSNICTVRTSINERIIRFENIKGFNSMSTLQSKLFHRYESKNSICGYFEHTETIRKYICISFVYTYMSVYLLI